MSSQVINSSNGSSSSRRRWSAVELVVQGLHWFKLPLKGNKRKEAEIPSDKERSPNSDKSDIVDPVYLAIKEATGKYGRKSFSLSSYDTTHRRSSAPCSTMQSQLSLGESDSEEMLSKHSIVMESKSANPDNSIVRRRTTRLTGQMKSQSLDIHDIPSKKYSGNATISLSPKTNLVDNQSQASCSDLPNWESSCTANSKGIILGDHGCHIVIHKYCSPNGDRPLVVGDRMQVVDSDPDWLDGFRIDDRTEKIITFPSSCVAAVSLAEQPMKLLEKVQLPGTKLRMHRDEIVFAQPNTLVDDKVTVRTTHNAYAPCQLTSLALI